MSIRSATSSAISNLGSYWNLPELGISEAVAGNSFNQGLDYSNPMSQAVNTDYSQYQSTGTYQPTATQNVLTPAQSSEINQSAQTYQAPQSTGPSDTRLQQLEKMSRNPVQEDEYQKLIDQLNAQKGPSQEEINNAYNPLLDTLNQYESNLKEQLPGLISDAEAQAKVSMGLLENQRTGANEQLGQQTEQTEYQRRTGVGEQRQTLQELQQANQARFGGASSAGLAASELQGREFQRGTAGINQQAQQALQQINLQKNQVERDYQQGVQQLEVNKQTAINDIKRTFQDRLAEIQAKRNETEAAKAQQRIAAAAEFRNAIFQINIQKAQFEQELKLQAQQNSSYLDNAAQQLLSYGQAGQSALDQFSGYQAPEISGVYGQGTSNQAGYYGQIGNNDELYGQIMGSSETDPRFISYVPR